MPNQGNQGNNDREDTTPTGTSGRQWPGGNENWQQGSNEATRQPADLRPSTDVRRPSGRARCTAMDVATIVSDEREGQRG